LISLREKTNQYAKNFQLTDNTITKLHIKEMITCVIERKKERKKNFPSFAGFWYPANNICISLVLVTF
jgi:hypothetical protein